MRQCATEMVPYPFKDRAEHIIVLETAIICDLLWTYAML